MLHHWLLFFFFSLTGAYAQDERYFRQMLNGDLSQQNIEIKDSPLRSFNINGPEYRVDLNDDKIEEWIQTQKRDGVDWLVIKNAFKSTIFETKLLAMGSESHIYKMRVVYLSTTVKAIIVFLDEGFTHGRTFESTGRIVLLSFENNDLMSIKAANADHFFHEKEAQREQYWRRQFLVDVTDLDGDGTREVAISFNHIQRIFQYAGAGSWRKL